MVSRPTTSPLMASHDADTDDDHAVRKFRGGWNESVSVSETLNCRGLSMWLSQGLRCCDVAGRSALRQSHLGVRTSGDLLSLSSSLPRFLIAQCGRLRCMALGDAWFGGARTVDGYFQCCSMGEFAGYSWSEGKTSSQLEKGACDVVVLAWTAGSSAGVISVSVVVRR